VGLAILFSLAFLSFSFIRIRVLFKEWPLVEKTQGVFSWLDTIIILLKFILIFFLFLDCFGILISKIYFKKLKKYYFNIFYIKKHFKKQFLPRFKQSLENKIDRYLNSTHLKPFDFIVFISNKF